MAGSRVHHPGVRPGVRPGSRLGVRLGLNLGLAALLAMAVATATAERPRPADRSPSTTSRPESEFARLREAVRGPVHIADSVRASVPGTLPAVVLLTALAYGGLAACSPRLSALRDPATTLRSRSPPIRPLPTSTV